MGPPKIEETTREERERYIRETFACRGDCDSCGICRVLKGKTPETAYADYIDGKIGFSEAAALYR